MNKTYLVGIVFGGAFAASIAGGCTFDADIGIDTQGGGISTGVGGSGDVGGCVGGAGGVEPGVTGAGGAEVAGVGGSGGFGGAGGAEMSGAGGSGGVGGGIGAGGAATCFDMSPGCAEYITAYFPEPWCDEVLPDPTPGTTNPSYVIYKDLFVCICGNPDDPTDGGKCKFECKNEVCAGSPYVAGTPCQKCITDNNGGCGSEFNTCANDV